MGCGLAGTSHSAFEYVSRRQGDGELRERIQHWAKERPRYVAVRVARSDRKDLLTQEIEDLVSDHGCSARRRRSTNASADPFGRDPRRESFFPRL